MNYDVSTRTLYKNHAIRYDDRRSSRVNVLRREPTRAFALENASSPSPPHPLPRAFANKINQHGSGGRDGDDAAKAITATVTAATAIMAVTVTAATTRSTKRFHMSRGVLASGYEFSCGRFNVIYNKHNLYTPINFRSSFSNDRIAWRSIEFLLFRDLIETTGSLFQIYICI